MQISDGTLKKYLFQGPLSPRQRQCRMNLQAGNFKKVCQLNRANPRDVKDKSCKLSKSAKHSYLPHHSETVLTQHKGNIKEPTQHREESLFFRKGPPKIV